MALKALVVLDLDGHDEVAGCGTSVAGLAIATQPQLAARRNTGRDLDIQVLVRTRTTLAVAVLTRLVDDGALATAIRTRGARLHLAEDGALDGGHIAGAVAARTGLLLATLFTT